MTSNRELEEPFNIKLLKLVKSNPCIYDCKSNYYYDRNRTIQAWNDISKELNSSVKVCKTRWKNLRNVYRRQSLSKSFRTSTGIFTREYYLANHLAFYAPFVKERSNKESTAKTSNREEILMPDDHASYSRKDETQADSSEYYNDDCEEYQDDDTSGDKNNDNNEDQKDLTYVDEQQISNGEKILKSDVQFLLSLLPDISTMTKPQKRSFKIGVMHLLNDVVKGKEYLMY